MRQSLCSIAYELEFLSVAHPPAHCTALSPSCYLSPATALPLLLLNKSSLPFPFLPETRPSLRCPDVSFRCHRLPSAHSFQVAERQCALGPCSSLALRGAKRLGQRLLRHAAGEAKRGLHRRGRDRGQGQGQGLGAGPAAAMRAASQRPVRDRSWAARAGRSLLMLSEEVLLHREEEFFYLVR